MKKIRQRHKINKREEGNSSNLTLYPTTDDIYNKEKKIGELSEDSNDEINGPSSEITDWHDKEFNPDSKRDKLDVPGAELDDKDEVIGEEDEENNYYSIGGDNHNDLEEGGED